MLRGSTHYCAIGSRGEGVGKRSADYKDCSSLALNAAGEGANFTSILKNVPVPHCSVVK